MSGDRYKITEQHSPHFLTFTLVDWVDVFTRKECKQIIVDSLNFCVKEKELNIYAWCLMSNHLHLVVSSPKLDLSYVIRDFKKWTAKEILAWMQNEKESRRDWLLYRFAYHGKYRSNVEVYHVWDDSNHAVLLSWNAIFWQKINYTHNNPVRAMIVDEPEEYLHSSARDYKGKKGLVEVCV